VILQLLSLFLALVGLVGLFALPGDRTSAGVALSGLCLTGAMLLVIATRASGAA